MQRFFSELHRRKVLRIASGYVVAGWVILQVALSLQTALKLPDSFATIIVSLLIIGFPVALVVSWFFEITSDGIKRTVASGDGAPIKPQTPDFILAGMLALVLVVGVIQAVMPHGNAPIAPTTTVEAPVLDKSIAVLPFENLSPDKDDAFFADGLAEEVLNTLAQIRGIRVISRTSSFTFKGKGTPLPEIARQLNVGHILEGSVRREGDDVRVTAQLIEVASDAHIWSQTFERKVENVFAVQDEIATAIARALDIELSVSTVPRAALTKNLEAYRVYLQGRVRSLDGGSDRLFESAEFYKRAIALDERFAEAHGELAASYAGLIRRDAHAMKEFEPLARQSANTALNLKPNLASARAVIGILARYKLEWADALENSLRAVALDPSDSISLSGLAYTQLMIGEFDQATRTQNTAKRVDPLYNRIGLATQALSAFARGDDQAVIAIASKYVETPHELNYYAHGFLSIFAQAKGDHSKAEEHFRLFMNAYKKNESIIEPVVRALKSRAKIGAAVKALKVEALRDSAFEPDLIFLILDDEDAFIDALVSRVVRGDTSRVAVYLPHAWHLLADGKVPMDKFKKFLREVGLVDYWRKSGWPDRCRAKGEDDFECS